MRLRRRTPSAPTSNVHTCRIMEAEDCGISRHLLNAVCQARSETRQQCRRISDAVDRCDDYESCATNGVHVNIDLIHRTTSQLLRMKEEPPAPPQDRLDTQQYVTPPSSCRQEEEDSGKRARVIWSDELHMSFLQAVASLGLRQSVPKAIMQHMKHSGLKRENVASHLQKYRQYLRRRAGILSTSNSFTPAEWAKMERALAEHLKAVAPHIIPAAVSLSAPPAHQSSPGADVPKPFSMTPLHAQRPSTLSSAPAAWNVQHVPRAQPQPLPVQSAAPMMSLVPQLADATPAAGVCMTRCLSAKATMPQLSPFGLPAGMLLPPPDADGMAIGVPSPYPLCIDSRPSQALNSPCVPRNASHLTGDDTKVAAAAPQPAANVLPLPVQPASLMPAGFTPDVLVNNLQLVANLIHPPISAERNHLNSNNSQPASNITPNVSDKTGPSGHAHANLLVSPAVCHPHQPPPPQAQLVYVPCHLTTAPIKQLSIRDGTPKAAMLHPAALGNLSDRVVPQMFSLSMAAYQASHLMAEPACATVAEGEPCKAESSLSAAPASSCKAEVSSQRREPELTTVKCHDSDQDVSKLSALDTFEREVLSARGGIQKQPRPRRTPTRLLDDDDDGASRRAPNLRKRVASVTRRHAALAPEHMQTWLSAKRRQPCLSIGLGMLAEVAAALEGAGSL